MTQRDLCATFFDGDVVKNATSQSRTNRTVGLSFRHQALDDRISVAFDNAKWYAKSAQILRQNVRWKAGLLLIEVNSQKFKIYRCTPLHVEQQIEQRIAIFAA